MIRFALRRSHNIQWQHLEVTREAHAALKGQAPTVLWFTGLSGAGKSTIANLVETQAAPAGTPHLPARRRQYPPRPEQGSGLHRRRPGREYPPHRRGRPADGGRRPDRPVRLHLAVPRRAADGARHAPRRRVLRDLRRHAARRSGAARRQGPLRQGARAATCPISPASTAPTRRPSRRRSGSIRPRWRPTRRPSTSSTSCSDDGRKCRLAGLTGLEAADSRSVRPPGLEPAEGA